MCPGYHCCGGDWKKGDPRILKGPLRGQWLRRFPQSSLWQIVHECPNKSARDTTEEMEFQAAEAAHHLYCLL